MSETHGKQFTLYSSGTAPNPWKVVIILEELGLDYHIANIDITKNEQKEPSFLKFNPNGRVPALVDHANKDFTIWESGAIIQYLVGKYDKQHKISFADFDENALANQYLIFQVSGQGPYFGQLGWFSFYHAEKVPSAITRYANEVRRVLGVLEDILKDREYLVGEKATYADLSFLPWNWIVDNFTQLDGWKSEFPNVVAWQGRLEDRDAVKKVRAAMKALKKA